MKLLSNFLLLVLFLVSVAFCSVVECIPIKTITANRIIISDNSGKRMQVQTGANFTLTQLLASPPTPGTSSFSFSLGNSSQNSGRFQVARNPIIGFGGSFMRAGAMMLNSLSKPKQDALLRDLFDPVIGAGFRVGKVPVAATDFQSPVWYSYEDTRGRFSIDYDLSNENGTIPYIKKAAAAAGRNFTLESTMDYPPQWMLNTSTPLPKARVNTTLYPELAQYFIDFFTSFAEAGVEISFLDMWNEPFESYTSVTQSQAAAMLKDYLAPRVHEMRRQGKQTPLLAFGCQYGREISYEEWRVFLEDPEMIKATDFYAVHGYDSYFTCVGGIDGTGINSYENTTVPNIDQAFLDFRRYIDTFRESNPTAPTMMTEVCYATEFNNYPSNTSICPKIPRLDFMDSMQWGRMIFGDLHAGATGWLYWNLILNTSGGPWLESPMHNDPFQNPQQPVIVVDAAKDSYETTGCYYAMSHFGRFVLPGMNKVENFFRSQQQLLPPNVYGIAFIGDANVTPQTADYLRPQVMNTTSTAKRLVLNFMNDRLDEFQISLAMYTQYFSNNNDDVGAAPPPFVGSFALPPVSFVTMEFILGDVSTQISPLPFSHNDNNNNNNDDDSLKNGWQGPVLGTICALVGVAIVTILFWRKIQNSDDNNNNQNQNQENESGGEYKAMA